jgi:Ser/Thr protein kinase RdoA (MazF antagonist)
MGENKMNQIPVVRSFVAADALADLIAADYNLAGPVRCQMFSKMVRTQDNDHYLVTTGEGQKLVVRVYQLGSRLERRESDYLYEVDWLNFLHNAGLRVSYPIPRADGRLLGSLNAPEGVRYYALFSLASGRPMSLENEEQLFVLGREMARIHLASNEYKGAYKRQPMNLEFLVDKPIERIKQYWDEDRASDLEIMMISAEEAKEEIVDLIANEQYTPDSWGPIGGDFHGGSVFFTDDNQPTFFNFDWCGPGWRAYDIAVFLFNTNLIHNNATELSEAFFAGYYSQRQLSDNEHAAIAPFLTIRRIWQTGLFSMNDGLVGHTFIASAHN